MDHYQSREEHEKVSAIMQQKFDIEIVQEDKSKVVTDLVRSIKERSLRHQLEQNKSDLVMVGQLMAELKSVNKIIIRL